MHNLPLCLFFRLPPGFGAQKVRVDEEVEANPAESVDLRCQFIDGGGRTKLTQVGRWSVTLCFPVALEALKLRMSK